tara:strand:- start:32 stop:559 length:528 start_codon:yes stop_codon:yes gene_type:complete
MDDLYSIDFDKIHSFQKNGNIDKKAKNQLKHLLNNPYRINTVANSYMIKKNGGRNIEIYNLVKCCEMIKGVFYIIDPIYFYERLNREFPDELLISNTHINAMKFDKIVGKHCKFISRYGNNTFFRMDKHKFYNTIEDEITAINKRNIERNMMRLILNRKCFLGNIEINKIVNEYL